MRSFRLLGLIAVALGLGVLGADLAAAVRAGTPMRLSALGEWWFALHPGSLQLLQPAIERHVSPGLWDPYVLTLLEWPLALEALGLGAVLLLLGRPWRRR
ncbi:MAG: hypothetical protein RQ752_04505 [Thermohalobaculum sp.]|nr:hypothetical protein [Thermohalobaculum sp.]